jgi:Tfp pilus assembly protein PilF
MYVCMYVCIYICIWDDPDKAGTRTHTHTHTRTHIEQMYRRALNADPKHVPSLRNLGYFLYYVRRDYSGASTMWSRALVCIYVCMCICVCVCVCACV